MQSFSNSLILKFPLHLKQLKLLKSENYLIFIAPMDKRNDDLYYASSILELCLIFLVVMLISYKLDNNILP